MITQFYHNIGYVPLIYSYVKFECSDIRQVCQFAKITYSMNARNPFDRNYNRANISYLTFNDTTKNNNAECNLTR